MGAAGGAAPATSLAAVAALAGGECARVRTGLACSAASGNPAPEREPAGCLPGGLPPGRHPRQGRYASLRDRLRRPLTRPSTSRPGDTGRPGRAWRQINLLVTCLQIPSAGTTRRCRSLSSGLRTRSSEMRRESSNFGCSKSKTRLGRAPASRVSKPDQLTQAITVRDGLSAVCDLLAICWHPS
jgi:hypothetical protein